MYVDFSRRNSYAPSNLAIPRPKSGLAEIQLRTLFYVGPAFKRYSLTIYAQNFPQDSSSTSGKQVVSPEEVLRHLFHEYRVGKDNTQLLSEALAFASPH
jgi:hypothetical protein